jgi:F0F1-type ATP synthase assembly protein I
MVEDRPRRSDLARYLEFAQVGVEMVAPLVLGLVLDHYLGWTPWLMIAGAVLGLVGGLYRMVALANRINREEERSREEPPP